MTLTDRNLQPETLLKATYRGTEYLAKVVTGPEPITVMGIGPRDNSLNIGRFLGVTFNSVSKAAMAITGNSVNGWRWWSIAALPAGVVKMPDDYTVNAEDSDLQLKKTGPAPRPASERFWEHVDKNGPIPDFAPELGPCWIWTGAKDKGGYGNFNVEHNRTEGVNRFKKAHTFAFEEADGPMPEGLEPDHLCRVHACVRRSHLEAVTRSVNLRRGAGIGGALSDGSNPNLEAARAAKRAGRARSYNPIKRTPNQKGVADGLTRYFCDACQGSFTAPELALTPKDDGYACPNGHTVAGMRQAALGGSFEGADFAAAE